MGIIVTLSALLQGKFSSPPTSLQRKHAPLAAKPPLNCSYIRINFSITFSHVQAAIVLLTQTGFTGLAKQHNYNIFGEPTHICAAADSCRVTVLSLNLFAYNRPAVQKHWSEPYLRLFLPDLPHTPLAVSPPHLPHFPHALLTSAPHPPLPCVPLPRRTH